MSQGPVTKKQRRSSAPMVMAGASNPFSPTQMPPIPQLPAGAAFGEQKEAAQPVAPVLQQARDQLAAARAKAKEAAALAANPPSLPITPAHNTLGEPLRDVLHPFSPEGEEIIPVRIEIDGALLEPAVDRKFADVVLWNALDSSLTPEAFAKVTCDEVGLPEAFNEAIVGQIRRTIKDYRLAVGAVGIAGAAGIAAGVPILPSQAASAAASAFPGAAASTAGALAAGSNAWPALSGSGGGSREEHIVTLDLHVQNDTGIELRDRLLWDLASPSPTPEEFARRLCADLGVGVLEGAVAFAIRDQLTKLAPNGVVGAQSAGAGAATGTADDASAAAENGTDPASVVRTEREALDWSPQVSLPNGPGATELEAQRERDTQEAERRDRMRRRDK